MRFVIKELQDLFWLPGWYRDLMTDVLEYLSTVFGAYDRTLPLVERLLETESSIVDFGSGAGGPLITRLLPSLLNRVPKLQVTLTDLYPNERAISEINARKRSIPVNYRRDSIDMTSPPSQLSGARTMFTSFHHLSETAALNVLRNAQEHRAPIGIFEATGRTPAHFLMALVIPLLVFVITPFIRGRRALRFVSTYIVPLVPLGCLWDGIVSNLRTYSKRDLERLIQQLPESSTYQFSIGTFSVFGPIRGTYLIGTERKKGERTNLSSLKEKFNISESDRKALAEFS